jgi:thiol-disulfide isomerase/thioredoxin
MACPAPERKSHRPEQGRGLIDRVAAAVGQQLRDRSLPVTDGASFAEGVVLGLLASGLTDEQVAARLGVPTESIAAAEKRALAHVPPSAADAEPSIADEPAAEAPSLAASNEGRVHAVPAADWRGIADRCGELKRPLVLYCGAEWCGPCKTVAPAVDRIAAANPHVLVLKVDADDESTTPTVMEELKLATLPTFVLFVDGAEAKRLPGASEYMLKLLFASVGAR